MIIGRVNENTNSMNLSTSRGHREIPPSKHLAVSTARITGYRVWILRDSFVGLYGAIFHRKHVSHHVLRHLGMCWGESYLIQIHVNR